MPDSHDEQRNPSPRDDDREEPGATTTSIEIPPPYPPPKAVAALNFTAQAQSQTTAAMFTGLGSLVLVLFGCLQEVQVLLCLGLTTLVVSLVLVFLAGRNVVEARRNLEEYLAEQRLYGERLATHVRDLEKRVS